MENEFLQNEHKPDIVALQEVPLFALERNVMLSEYNLIGYQESHAPYVALFVHQKWNAKVIRKGMGQLPAVVAEIDFSSNNETNESASSNSNNPPRRRLWIASVHLEPFADGASVRKRQLKALASQAREEKVPLIIAGDTNMRVAEDNGAEDDLGLHDFWKLAGSEFRTKFTVSPVDCGSNLRWYYNTH
jgi:endonuclease/exonuclease/phosphatase family metal-dependent hydrolase